MSSRQKCRLVAREELSDQNGAKLWRTLRQYMEMLSIQFIYLSIFIYIYIYIYIYTIYVYNKMDMTSLSIASKCLMNEFNFVFRNTLYL